MKSFEEIYKEVCSASKDRLNEVKSKNNRFLLIVALSAIAINTLIYMFSEEKYIISLTISLSVCLLIFLIANASKIYRKIYKTCVIDSLVKQYNEKLHFDQEIGIPRMEYKISNFDNNVDDYFSEDRIYGRLRTGEPIQVAEVATYVIKEYKDAEGNTKQERTETFRGMYGIVRLEKNILSDIRVATNSNIKKFSKSRIEVDSAEFEKYYDIFTQDKVTAMRIFTADLIEKYIDIMNVSNKPFEIKIQDNLIFFRYRCGHMFEPPTFTNGLDENLIRKYYKFIFYPLEVIEKTVENINSIVE